MPSSNLKGRVKAAVYTALRRGVLVRADTCEVCGTTAAKNRRGLDAHHHNGYELAHWLDVQWLCRTCHMRIHGHVKNFTTEERRHNGHKGGTVAGPIRATQGMRDMKGRFVAA